MPFIHDRYHELLELRAEGLRKVGTALTDDIERPKSRSFLPTVWSASRTSSMPSVALGPLRVGAIGPSLILAEEALAGRARVKVLDVGCGPARFREYLRMRDPDREVDYVGMDSAPPPLDFPVYLHLDDVPDRDFDLILMSEVAEHMDADTFVAEYLAKFPALLATGGAVVVTVPNPLCPTSLHRDMTHVQHYPWYDMYALLRWFFGSVDVVRTHFVSSPRRLLSYPFRRAFSYALEIDWCEGIAFVARDPR